jgi:hypothetical protein
MIKDKKKGAITQGTGRQLEEARPGGFNCKARIVDQRQAHVEAEVIYPPVMPDPFWTYKQGPSARNQDPFIIFLTSLSSTQAAFDEVNTCIEGRTRGFIGQR